MPPSNQNRDPQDENEEYEDFEIITHRFIEEMNDEAYKILSSEGHENVNVTFIKEDWQTQNNLN